MKKLLYLVLFSIALTGCAKKLPPCEIVNGEKIYNDQGGAGGVGNKIGIAADNVGQFFSDYGVFIFDSTMDAILLMDSPDISKIKP